MHVMRMRKEEEKEREGNTGGVRTVSCLTAAAGEEEEQKGIPVLSPKDCGYM